MYLCLSPEMAVPMVPIGPRFIADHTHTGGESPAGRVRLPGPNPTATHVVGLRRRKGFAAHGYDGGRAPNPTYGQVAHEIAARWGHGQGVQHHRIHCAWRLFLVEL
jgi:hypothetical protein